MTTAVVTNKSLIPYIKMTTAVVILLIKTLPLTAVLYPIFDLKITSFSPVLDHVFEPSQLHSDIESKVQNDYQVN